MGLMSGKGGMRSILSEGLCDLLARRGCTFKDNTKGMFHVLVSMISTFVLYAILQALSRRPAKSCAMFENASNLTNACNRPSEKEKHATPLPFERKTMRRSSICIEPN